MTRALLLENPHKTADEVLMRNGIEVVRNPGAFDEAELIHTLQEVGYLDLRSKTNVACEMFEANPQLEATGAFCIGANQIDLEATIELGICVFNTPYSSTRSVVELAIGETISLCRRVTVESSRPYRDIWDRSTDGTYEVQGRTLGITGYGNIGTQLSVLAEAMGLNVIFYDVAERLALGNVTQMPMVGFVLREAGIVPVHVDNQPISASLFGTREFAMVKPGALFINLSRGLIVDIDTLHDALVLGHLTGAVANVFPEEPNKNGDLFAPPLAKLDNVILTPHIGGSTEETQYDIGHFVANRIANYESTDSTGMSMNLTNLQLSASEGSHYRIALIHRNAPGILTTVNNTFAQTGANVDIQILGTTGQTGYVLMDINSELPVKAIRRTRSMKDTVRLITTRL